jgi:N-ethylmaleimide reductase
MPLFQTIQIGDLVLPNRVVMAPMTRRRAEGGLPTSLMAAYYAQRASAGLIVTEATHVSAETAHSALSPGIHSEAQVNAWREVSAAVHAAGGRIFMQLWHLGRAWHGAGSLPVGASAIAARVSRPDAHGILQPLPIPAPLDAPAIRRIVHQFQQAARNAISAGMDGVEINAGNGFLIDQFLRDGSNQRIDGYGGSCERRCSLLLEVVEKISRSIGGQRLGVRLSPRKTFNDMSDSSPYLTFGCAVQALNSFGIAYVHLAGEGPDSTELDPTTQGIEAHLRSIWRGALILNGGYSRESAQRALAAGEADMVSFGNAYIANPDLVRRLETNARLNEIRQAFIYQGASEGFTDYPALDEQP